MKKLTLIATLILPILIFAQWTTPDWQAIARQDITALFQTLSHNHPGVLNPDDRAFNDWLHQGYEQALSRLDMVDSEHAYRAILQFYAAGFNDTHLRIFFGKNPKTLNWAGFHIKYQNDKYIVSHVSDDSAYSGHVPPVGSELLLCDDVTPKQYIIKNISPFCMGLPEIESHHALFASRITCDYSNPWVQPMQTCTFLVHGKKISIDLTWQLVPFEEFERKRMILDGFSDSVDFSITDFGNNSVWVKLPNFYPSGEEVKKLNTIISKLAQCTSKDYVIFDIRGHGGGSSDWGKKLLASLHGKKYIDYISAKAESPEDLCATQETLKKYEGCLADEERIFGKESDDYKESCIIVQRIKEALTQSPLSLIRFEVVQAPSGNCENPIQAKILVITDYICRSAALTFIDWIKAIPGSKQVGLPTFSDTLYNDAHFVGLPSGNVKLMFPTKVYKEQIRKSNESHMPDVRFDGNIQNTDALKAWIKDKFNV